jgi:hypothetical protein
MNNTFEHSEQDQGPEHQPVADDHVPPMGEHRLRQRRMNGSCIALRCDRLREWFEGCIDILQVNRRKNVGGVIALKT